jgi:hypothetical protein
MEESQKSTIGIIAKEITLALQPLAAAGESMGPTGVPELFQLILEQAGLTLDRAIGADAVQAIRDALAKISTAYNQVAPILVREQPPELEEITQVVASVREIFTAVQELSSLNLKVEESPNVLVELQDLARMIAEGLIAEYLGEHHPTVFNILEQVGIIELGNLHARQARDRLTRLQLLQIIELLQDPTGALKTLYGWGGLGFDPYRMLTPLAFLLRSLNFPAAFSYLPGNDMQAVHDTVPPKPDLALLAPLYQQEIGVAVEVGVAALPLRSAQGAAEGLAIIPYGLANKSVTLDVARDWELIYQFSGAVAGRYGIVIRFHEVKVAPLDGSAAVDYELRASAELARKTAPSGRFLLLGEAGLGGVEAMTAGVKLGFALQNGKPEFVIELAVKGAQFVFDKSRADGFLQAILPQDGLTAPFDFTVGWSSTRGLYFLGGAALEANFPIQKTLLGILFIHSLYCRILARADAQNRDVEVVASALFSVKLGPVTVNLERVGFRAYLTFPPIGGNLGLANLDFRFKPPDGAGLAIDAGVVVGGGYLWFDPVKEQYAGAVQLEVGERVSLTAFGLLTTRMPDGAPGFSLLVLIAATFDPPIDLGYGFRLHGVGGLVGVNRTVAVDRLRAGLRAGTASAILFPALPVRNAPQLVSDLAAVFPVAEGRFLFGPVARLSWGTPTLLTLDLGLVLELPAPVRLVLLGRLRVLLPDEQHPVVRLQLDALGVIDFESGDVALDAALYESEVAGFAVTGQMALRANFGARPNLVLAVGGFHPSFPAPPGFPALERVALSLATGDTLRLRLEAYLALTTNTMQFGARLDLYAEWQVEPLGKLSVAGTVGFDALLQFNPFGFIAELGVLVALKYEDQVLLAVTLDLMLSGPTPWQAVGQAHFQLLGWDIAVGFAVQSGPAEPPPLPAPVRLQPLLLAALQDPGNWTTPVAGDAHPIVALREPSGGADTLVHPWAEVQVRQRVVPLGREVSRFGNTVPEGERRFEFSVVGAARGGEAVYDFFAPGQFWAMSDAEKLAAPAFERLPAGIRLPAGSVACGEPVVEADSQYEVRTIRAPAAGAEADDPAPLSSAVVEQVAAVGAAGLAPLRHTGVARYRVDEGAAARTVRLKPPTYSVIDVRAAAATSIAPTGTLAAFASSTTGQAGRDDDEEASYMAAMETLHLRLAAHPEERARLRVVPSLQGVSS